MPYIVDFVNVSTVGLETSPVVDALAGLRANEARYFRTSTTTTSPHVLLPRLPSWSSTSPACSWRSGGS